MSILKYILRVAAPLPRPETFDRYLFVAPHPDDIEIGAGATAARLAAMGKKITFLICIDGRYGDGQAPGLSREELIETRRQEAIRSAAVLGVTDVRFLNLCDGGFYREEELLIGIAKAIGEVQPEVILAPDPNPTTECHPDHVAVGQAAKRLACMAPYAGIMERYGAKAADVKALALYMTAKPNRFVKSSRALFAKQIEALNCHVSQYPKGSGELSSICLYLTLRSHLYGLHCLRVHGEGFRVMGPIHMHCLPEAEQL